MDNIGSFCITATPISGWLIDAFLLTINIFNAYVLFTHLHPVDSPLKRPFVDCMLRIVDKAHSTPLVVSATLTALLSITACSAIQYNFSIGADAADGRLLIRAIVSAYSFATTSIFVKLSDHMIKLSVDRILELEREVMRHDIVRWEPPSKSLMEAVVAPYRAFFKVESTGLENIPDDGTPHLFVSNHSLYGLEMPLFVNHLYQRKDIYPRGLADHFHFMTPNGPILRAFGAVDGTRDNVDALMEAKQNVLVYPGGGHEVLKKSTVPRYELMWKERLGFARCAIKHGYAILPSACVGTEDMFDSIGDLPTGFNGMVIPISVTTPCKVQKVYMWFGRPISTSQYNGEYRNDEYAKEVRDKTKMAIEEGIRELQARQDVDPERYLVDRYASKIRGYFASTATKAASGDSSGEEVVDGSSMDEKDEAVGDVVVGEDGGKLKMK